MWPTDPIETDRLLLRPTRHGDEEDIVSLFADAQVRRYLGGALAVDEARRRVGTFSDDSTKASWGHFAIVERDDGAFVGTLSFRPLPSSRPSYGDERNDWEVNYSLRVDRWGRGLAAEALSGALTWFWEQRPDVKQVIAETQSVNERSCRLLERLGATLRQVYDRKGADQREYVLSRTGT